jgi:hypothetical protein
MLESRRLLDAVEPREPDVHNSIANAHARRLRLRVYAFLDDAFIDYSGRSFCHQQNPVP